MRDEDKCPMCGLPMDECECETGGGIHPNAEKWREVVLDHLYLFSDKQIEHIKDVEKSWEISYEDEERSEILRELEHKAFEVDSRELLAFLDRMIKFNRDHLKNSFIDSEAYFCEGALDAYSSLKSAIKSFLKNGTILRSWIKGENVYTCPVCGYSQIEEPDKTCPHCGVPLSKKYEEVKD